MGKSKVIEKLVRIFKSEEEKHELVNVDIEFISLVKNPANRQDFVYKSESGKGNNNIEKTISIQKYDEEKGIVYGAVYSPDIPDAHNDFMTTEEIEKTCHNFAKNLRLANIDKEHNFQKAKAHVVESFILKGTHPDYPNVPEGSWAIAVKVEDEELKSQVKKGEFRGFSMAGKAIRKSKNSTNEEEKEVNKKLEKLVKGMQNLAGEIAKLQKSGGSTDEISSRNAELSALNKKFEAMQKELDELKNADSDSAGDDSSTDDSPQGGDSDSEDAGSTDLQKSIDGMAKAFEAVIKKSNQLELDGTKETHVNLLLKSAKDPLIEVIKSGAMSPSDLEISGELTPDQTHFMFEAITGGDGFLSTINSLKMKKLKGGKDLFDLPGDILVRVPEGAEPSDAQKNKIVNLGEYFNLLPTQAFFEITKSTLRNNSDDPNFLQKMEARMITKIAGQIEKLACVGTNDLYSTSGIENLKKGLIQRAKEEVATGNYIKKGTDFTTDNIFTLVEDGLTAADSNYLDECVILMSPQMALAHSKKMGYADNTAKLLMDKKNATHLGYQIKIVKHFPDNVIMVTPLNNLLFAMHTEVSWVREFSLTKRVLSYIYDIWVDFGIGIPEATVLLTNET